MSLSSILARWRVAPQLSPREIRDDRNFPVSFDNSQECFRVFRRSTIRLIHQYQRAEFRAIIWHNWIRVARARYEVQVSKKPWRESLKMAAFRKHRGRRLRETCHVDKTQNNNTNCSLERLRIICCFFIDSCILYLWYIEWESCNDSKNRSITNIRSVVRISSTD